jgi:hypothetical protein
MIKHIVFWKILEKGSEADRFQAYQQFKAAVSDLQAVIPEIKQATVGYNFLTGDIFHVCIDSVFADEKDLQIYINHPEHLKLRAYLNTISYEKAIFDYEF